MAEEKKKVYYKGFDKDLKCRDFQYEIGKTYETDEAKLCECGFHACEAPLDVLRYYPPNDGRYCEVELDGVSDERKNDDSKVVGKKITVGAEIGIPGLVKAHVEWVKEKTAVLAAKLQGLSPLEKLKNGYGYVSTKQGAVKSARDVSAGDAVSIRLSDGVIETEVKGIQS